MVCGHSHVEGNRLQKTRQKRAARRAANGERNGVTFEKKTEDKKKAKQSKGTQSKAKQNKTKQNKAKQKETKDSQKVDDELSSIRDEMKKRKKQQIQKAHKRSRPDDAGQRSEIGRLKRRICIKLAIALSKIDVRNQTFAKIFVLKEHTTRNIVE